MDQHITARVLQELMEPIVKVIHHVRKKSGDVVYFPMEQLATKGQIKWMLAIIGNEKNPYSIVYKSLRRENYHTIHLRKLKP